MAEPRKADAFAGKRSLLDRLRKRRTAVEDGDLEGAAAAFEGIKDGDADDLTEEEFDKLPDHAKARLRGDG